MRGALTAVLILPLALSAGCTTTASVAGQAPRNANTRASVNANAPTPAGFADADYARHVEYCYINPVKHALVHRVQDWPHSSFHRDVEAGIVPLDWAGEVDVRGQFGERA